MKYNLKAGILMKKNRDLTLSSQTLRQSLLLIMLLSALLLAWHSIGMNTVFALNQESTIQLTAFSDRENGGNSSADFHWSEDGGILSCTIKTDYQWPYCEVSFQIRTHDTPLDLTQYDTAHLKIRSLGEGPQNIKIYLRNLNPDYSSADKKNSLKINQIQYDPNKESRPLAIPLDTFVVPAWWLNHMQLSPLYAAQEIDQILFIEIATGDYRQAGPHKVVIESMEFSRQVDQS